MNAVLTGDTTNTTPYIILMVVAVVIVAGVVIYKKRFRYMMKSFFIEAYIHKDLVWTRSVILSWHLIQRN